MPKNIKLSKSVKKGLYATLSVVFFIFSFMFYRIESLGEVNHFLSGLCMVSFTYFLFKYLWLFKNVKR